MGAVSVEIDLKSLNTYIRLKHGSPRALTGDERFVLRQFTQLIQQAVRDRWPVDTGTSRDRWIVYSVPTAGDLSIFVENPMFYAEYVNNGLWERLVPAVWNAVKPELIREMKREIDKTERRLESSRGVPLLELLRALA